MLDRLTYDIVYGIYEGELPSDVTLRIDDGNGFGPAIPLNAAQLTEYELTPSIHTDGTDGLELKGYFTRGAGKKRIMSFSNTLGRINYRLFLKIDIIA